MTKPRHHATPGDPHDIEVEWQFDALDLRPVERWLAALPNRTINPEAAVVAMDQEALGTTGPGPLTARAKTARRLVDRYLDTEDWRIAQAGFVLRTRRRGRHDEATLKDLGPATTGGLRTRLELTEVLSGGDLDALSHDGEVGRRVQAVVGKRPLRCVLEVRTRRRPFSLRIAGRDVAELALDDTTIVGGNERPVRLRRVEVEVDPDWLGALEPMVEDLVATCGLRAATLSKFEAGLLGLGLSLPGPPQLGSTEVAPSSTMAEVAFAVLRRHLRQLLAHEPGTRLGEDPEHLHDMRVATRRLRAALELFAEVLPVRAHGARKELGWLGGVLGEVRDLDVQLGRHDHDATEMAEWLGGDQAEEALVPLRQRLVHERQRARADLLDALDSPRYERLTRSLVSLVTEGSPRRSPLSRTLAVVAIPELVMARHRSVHKAARRARRTKVAADFHRLRIRCKRLRYCLEFTSDVYGGRTDRYVRRLTKLQDGLGQLQDDETAVARLHQLAVGQPPLPAETIYVMGAVAGHYRSDASSLLHSLRKRLGVVSGTQWRDLIKEMERRRIEVLAEMPLARSLSPRPRSQGPASEPEAAVASSDGPAPAQGPEHPGAGQLSGDGVVGAQSGGGTQATG